MPFSTEEYSPEVLEWEGFRNKQTCTQRVQSPCRLDCGEVLRYYRVLNATNHYPVTSIAGENWGGNQGFWENSLYTTFLIDCINLYSKLFITDKVCKNKRGTYIFRFESRCRGVVSSVIVLLPVDTLFWNRNTVQILRITLKMITFLLLEAYASYQNWFVIVPRSGTLDNFLFYCIDMMCAYPV